MRKYDKTAAALQALSPEQYRVTQQNATEPPGSVNDAAPPPEPPPLLVRTELAETMPTLGSSPGVSFRV